MPFAFENSEGTLIEFANQEDLEGRAPKLLGMWWSDKGCRKVLSWQPLRVDFSVANDGMATYQYWPGGIEGLMLHFHATDIANVLMGDQRGTLPEAISITTDEMSAKLASTNLVASATVVLYQPSSLDQTLEQLTLVVNDDAEYVFYTSTNSAKSTGVWTGVLIRQPPADQ